MLLYTFPIYKYVYTIDTWQGIYYLQIEQQQNAINELQSKVALVEGITGKYQNWERPDCTYVEYA